jgi:hypothetical protein
VTAIRPAPPRRLRDDNAIVLIGPCCAAAQSAQERVAGLPLLRDGGRVGPVAGDLTGEPSTAVRRCSAAQDATPSPYTGARLAREGVPLNIIQRQPGHANLGTTWIYLQGIDPEEIITAVRTRRAPMMSATAGQRL